MSGQTLPAFPAPSLARWEPCEMKEGSVVFRKFRFLTGGSVYSSEVSQTMYMCVVPRASAHRNQAMRRALWDPDPGPADGQREHR